MAEQSILDSKSSERCNIALHAVNEVALLVDGMSSVIDRMWSHEGHEASVLRAIALRAKQLLEVASTMLGDDVESVEGKSNIVRYGCADGRKFEDSTAGEGQPGQPVGGLYHG